MRCQMSCNLLNLGLKTTLKKEEWVESFVDDEVENRGNADLDEILTVL